MHLRVSDVEHLKGAIIIEIVKKTLTCFEYSGSMPNVCFLVKARKLLIDMLTKLLRIVNCKQQPISPQGYKTFSCSTQMNMKLIIIKSLDPLRAKKTFIRKKLGHTMVSAIKASSVTLKIWQKEPEEKTVNLQILITIVVSKTDMSKNTKIYQIC